MTRAAARRCWANSEARSAPIRRTLRHPSTRWQRRVCEIRFRSFDLDLIVLDHGVRQELLGRLLERRLGRRGIAAVELQVENLALAHAADAGNAERLQRPLDRLALRIEDAGFQ